jgi:hypothetical protein
VIERLWKVPGLRYALYVGTLAMIGYHLTQAINLALTLRQRWDGDDRRRDEPPPAPPEPPPNGKANEWTEEMLPRAAADIR